MVTNDQIQQNQEQLEFTEAIFSNAADYTEELPFERGDILKVVSKKPDIEGAGEGWWFVEDKNGKRGIAPANRLKTVNMENGFFQVAAPLMDDFFALRSPFDDPFFRSNRMGGSMFNHERFDAAAPMRRMSSCDDALRNVGVIRNIPIRVQNINNTGNSAQSQPALNAGPNEQQNRFSDFGPHSNVPDLRRTYSTGRVSPHYMGPEERLGSGPATTRSTVESSEYDDDNRSTLSSRRPSNASVNHQVRTLVLPSTIPGQTIEIPLDTAPMFERPRSKSPRPDNSPTQLEKLTQRLKNLAKPFRVPSELQVPSSKASDRSVSPSSSGIDVESNENSADEKRVSDISSLSSSDHMGSLNDSPGSDTLSRPSGLFGPRAVPQPYIPRVNTLNREKSPSTSVLQTVFDSIERPTLGKYGKQAVSEWMLPTSVEEDIRKNQSIPWNHVPTTVMSQARSVGDILEEEVQARKRLYCNRLVEALQTIEGAVNSVSRSTSTHNWRSPHILSGNLSALRDSFAAISLALGSILDVSEKIAIERTHVKNAEMLRLISPVSEVSGAVARLRKSIEIDGWTISALGRTREHVMSNDSLNVLVNTVRQIPVDVRRFVQWVQLLIPSNQVVFLSPSGLSVTPLTTPTTPRPHQLELPVEDIKRLSTSSAESSVTSQPSSILVTKPNHEKPKGRVTFADEAGESSSTSSSVDHSSLEYATIQKPSKRQLDDRVLEEEDLESVQSDGDSLFHDYAYLDDVVPGRSQQNQERRNNLDDEDRQLVRFHVPQLEQHTDSLSMAIEEFLAAIENNLPPREFVQKGKLIILAAHRLIYIGDTVSQCIQNAAISEQLRQAADNLCELLKDCVKATKQAADEYPDIRRMQGMVDSIISVSHAAHQLKLMIGDCC